MSAEIKEAQCRCPLRPYGPSMASGSSWERARLEEWQRTHGHHAYAKARDDLAKALNVAETTLKREEQRKAGEAVMDMVHDVFGLLRRGTETKRLSEASALQCEEERCLPK